MMQEKMTQDVGMLDALLRKHYERFGFTIVPIPPFPLKKRAEYVYDLLKSSIHI